MRPLIRSPLPPAGVLVLASVIFAAMGLTSAVFGPALPELARKTQTSLTGIGTLFTAYFLGAVASELAAGPISDRIGQRPLIAAGMLSLASGAIGIALSPTLAILLSAAVVAGLGFGTLNVATNLLVAAVFVERRASALNLTNVFYGVGAIGAPALAALSLRHLGSMLPVLFAGAAVAVAGLPMVARLASSRVEATEATGAHQAPIYRDTFVLTSGIMLLLYVGLENGVGAWTATYLRRTTGAEEATAALLTSGYWLALTAGRGIGATLGHRVADEHLQRISVAGCAAFGALFVASAGQTLFTTIAVLGLGLCLGPVLPTTYSVTTRVVRHAPGAAVSLITAISSSGAMLLPWLQGTLLERVSPTASAALVAAMTATMLLLQIELTRRSRARLLPPPA